MFGLSVVKSQYSQGQCTGWRLLDIRSWRWRVHGKSSGAYRSGHASGASCRCSVPLPSVSLCKLGRWSRSRRSGLDESVPRKHQSYSEPVNPTGRHLNFSVSFYSAVRVEMILRSHSHGPGWWFRMMTAAWRSFLQKRQRMLWFTQKVAAVYYASPSNTTGNCWNTLVVSINHTHKSKQSVTLFRMKSVLQSSLDKCWQMTH